jgi:hypothetical protein
MSRVAPAKGDLAIGERDQAVVGGVSRTRA